MFKIGLTAVVTAALCFGIVAATGLARPDARIISMKTGDIFRFQNNLQCQTLSKTQVACGAKKLPNSVAVYFDAKQVNVVRFNKAGTNATVLFKIKR